MYSASERNPTTTTKTTVYSVKSLPHYFVPFGAFEISICVLLWMHTVTVMTKKKKLKVRKEGVENTEMNQKKDGSPNFAAHLQI